MASVTPYEVAYLEPPDVDSLGSLLFFNRMIDFIFLVDICINFNLAVSLATAIVAATR